MNQILDLLSSFLIGGIVLLALLGLNMQFTSKNQEIKLAEITQSSSTSIGRIIEHDFNKIGYGDPTDSSIVSISNNSITFRADLNNDGNIEVVNYSLINNANGKFVKRIINSNESKSWLQPIKNFQIFGLNVTSDTTYVSSQVSAVLVNLEYAKNDYLQDTLSIGVQWRRKFFPKNLD